MEKNTRNAYAKKNVGIFQVDKEVIKILMHIRDRKRYTNCGFQCIKMSTPKKLFANDSPAKISFMEIKEISSKIGKYLSQLM